ncbi:MAG: MFS transporter, partial [Terrimicrobiaceae bacterium]
ISLVLIGFADPISAFLQANIPALKSVAPATVTIALLGLFMVIFQFFNMFVSSVFYYIFNDVVPPQFLARFLGMFRLVGTGAGAIYNYFIFQYSESHMREIFLGAAVLYFIGFGLMCLRVKEGEYPPVEGESEKASKGLGAIKTYFSECFTHKLYWLMFTTSSILATSGVIGMFGVFYNREMGLSLDHIGKLGAISGAFSLIAVYVTAVFADRWNPLRILTHLRVFAVVGMISYWIWLFITLPGDYYFWLAMGAGIIGTFQYNMAAAVEFPMMMRLLPQSRFGQFCSAQAMIQCVFRLFTGVAAGLFVDAMKWFCHGSDFAYRFNFVWTTVFGALGAATTVWLYICWHKLGGDFHYHPPAPWSPKKQEELAVVVTVPPQTRWLNCSLYLFRATMAVSVLGLPALMWWMRHQEAPVAFRWFLMLILPLSLAVCVCWAIVERNIRRDMANCKAGKPLRNGIPHHGVLMTISTKYLLAQAMWLTSIVFTVNLKMDTAAVVFGLANVLTNLLLIWCVWLNCRIERGRSVVLDQWPAGTIPEEPAALANA